MHSPTLIHISVVVSVVVLSLSPRPSHAFFPWRNYPSALNLTLPHHHQHVSPRFPYHFPLPTTAATVSRRSQFKHPSQPAPSLLSCLPSSLVYHKPNTASYAHLLSRGFISTLTPAVLPLSSPPFHTRSPPSLITLPSSTSHVSHIIRCARHHSVPVCARSGGHSYLANTLCPGILIDLQKLRSLSLKGNRLTVGAGAVLGELALFLARRGKWFPIGVCPAVGVAGYLLGGGYSPYANRLGVDVACDAVSSVVMVDRFGTKTTASRAVAEGKTVGGGHDLAARRGNESLLWASCGGGGGQFGIVTSFTMTVFPIRRAKQISQQQQKTNMNMPHNNHKTETAYVGPFANGVVNFRIMWPTNISHLALSHWVSSYHSPSSKLHSSVWTRAELYRSQHEPGVYIYGMCFSVSTPSLCLSRLRLVFPSLMALSGHRVLMLRKAPSLLHAHAVLGAHGEWGRNPASIRPIARAFSGRFSMAGEGDRQMTMSAFVSKLPSIRTWKRFVRFCGSVSGLKSIPWTVCMLSPMTPKSRADVKGTVQRNRRRAFAFGHAVLLSDFIIGGGSEKEKRMAYYAMRNVWNGLRDGVYLNYAEMLLTNGKGMTKNKRDAYPTLYWGSKQLHRLMRLKRQWDPHNFFSALQPIPTPPPPPPKKA